MTKIVRVRTPWSYVSVAAAVAVIVQVPCASAVTTPPVNEHFEGVLDLRMTGSPEGAVADTA